MHIRHIREAHFQSGIVCPRCRSKSAKRNGKFSRDSDRQRYLCKNCGRTFTDTTGTPLAYAKKPNDLWTEVARCMREGMSCRKTAGELGIAVSTVFRRRHKILAALRERTDMIAVLQGIVEADETMFPRSYKGSHIKNPSDPDAQREAFRERFGRYAYKRGKQIHQRGRSRQQVPVLVCRDRSARTVSVVMKSMKTEDVRQHLLPAIDHNSVLCTDGLAVYQRVCKDEGIEHKSFNQSKGKRVDGVYHIQNVNAYHSRLKGWIAHFHGVSTKYLGNYMTWFAYIDTTRGLTSGTWEQVFLAKSCIDVDTTTTTHYTNRRCAICDNLITEGEAAGRLQFRSSNPRLHIQEVVCHETCYAKLVQPRTPA
jgi:transposase-like protein/IS1 family transposase